MTPGPKYTSINLPILEEYLHVNIQVFTFSSVFNVSISKLAIVISMQLQPYKFKALFFQVTLTFLDKETCICILSLKFRFLSSMNDEYSVLIFANEYWCILVIDKFKTS